MIRILAVVLTALTVVLGIHVVFALACAVTAVAVLVVASRAMEYGVRCVPRCAWRAA